LRLLGVSNAERSVGALDELLHRRFRRCQFGGGAAKVFDAFLEQRQGLGEIDRFRIELGSDLLEARDALLERLTAGSLRGHAWAGTVPSRNTRSNGISGVNWSIDVRARPSLPRATE